jgi:hypothetical protein
MKSSDSPRGGRRDRDRPGARSYTDPLMLSGSWEGEAPSESCARLGRSLALPGRSDSLTGPVYQNQSWNRIRNRSLVPANPPGR